MMPRTMRVYVCREPVDFRKQFDGLETAARDQLGKDAHLGGLFVFTNKRRNRLKVLWFERTGACILYKRADGVLFDLPRAASTGEISGEMLAVILQGTPHVRGRKNNLKK